MKPNTISMQPAIRFGWRTTLKNMRIFGPLLLISAFVWLLQNAVSGRYEGQPDLVMAPVASLAWVGLQVINMLLTMGWIRIALKLHDGERASLNDLLTVFPSFFHYLLASVLYGLIVAAGLILLVVPGIIWAAQFVLFGFVILDEHLDPIAALKRSSELTRGAKGQVILFGLLLFGINLVGAMALGVGLIVTLPLTALAMAHVYRQLVARAAKAVRAPTPQPPLPTATPTPA